VSARYDDHCQYCFYIWKNEYDDVQKVDSFQEQNRKQVSDCLVCNVNLCIKCDQTFHGADLSSYFRCTQG
jgi:hypothetical protein